MKLKTGTKSVLFGYHAFWLHGFFVLRAWYLLYGRPKKWTSLLAIFIHDLGYLGCSDMDGEYGRLHPERLTRWLINHGIKSSLLQDQVLLHSRHTAGKLRRATSMLCHADKLAFLLYPEWLLRALYALSGEYHEYLMNWCKDPRRWNDPNPGLYASNVSSATMEQYNWGSWYVASKLGNIGWLRNQLSTGDAPTLWDQIPGEIRSRLWTNRHRR